MVSRQGFEEYCFSDSVLRPDKAGLSADLLKKHKKDGQTFGRNNIFTIFALPFRKYFCREDNIGEVVEWSITAVLKTVELKGSGGSNPSLSAEIPDRIAGKRTKSYKSLICSFFYCHQAGYSRLLNPFALPDMPSVT